METKTPLVELKYFKKCERVEPLILDSSAYLDFKICPRLFFYKIVLGYRPKNSSLHLDWGTAYHKFREVLDLEYKEARKGLQGSNNEFCVSAPFAPAYKAAMQIWLKLQPKDPNPEEYFGFMTRSRLHETLMYAYKHWVREKQLARTEVLATEQLFNIIVKGEVRRSGKCDQLILRDGEFWVRDFKTTTKDVEQFQRTLEPNDQFTGYTIAGGELSGEKVKGVVVEVLFNKKKHKTDRGKSEVGPLIYEFTTQRTEEQLAQWKVEQVIVEQQIDICRQNDVWPQYDNSLTNCKFCAYHRPCSMSNEDAAEYNLRNFYTFNPHDHTKFGESSES